MNKDKHKILTQKYSSWGDKLLQHTDVLYKLQNDKVVSPVTIQISLTEKCDCNCTFCSVKNRPIYKFLKFDDFCQLAIDFKKLGAKSIELTGGGNPLLYKDLDKNINDVIKFGNSLGYKIGIITNSYTLKQINNESYDKIDWVRISLSWLDVKNFDINNYVFQDFPLNKLSFSYIINDNTTIKTIENIMLLINKYENIKFVRLAGDCLKEGNNKKVQNEFKKTVDELDKNNKCFFKDIDDEKPFHSGCFIGGIRPYIAPSPNGDEYQVYVCTSYVLNKQNYDLDYSLGSIKNILSIWEEMSHNLKNYGYLYKLKEDINWYKDCNFCFYKNNNSLLHTVITELPDKNFA